MTIMLEDNDNRYASQEALMCSIYRQDSEPYYASSTGETVDGLTYEAWAVMNNENSQEYLVQDLDGFWRRSYLGEM